MMSKLIYRHFAAGKRAIFFTVCISLGIFTLTLLIHLSTVCGNLKGTGITEHPVYPMLFMLMTTLSAMTPMTSDFIAKDIKTDYSSGFAKYLAASPVTHEENIFSFYASQVIYTAAMLLLSAAYLAIFIAMGVIKPEPAAFLPLIAMGVADMSVIAVMIPCLIAKDEIKAYFFMFVLIMMPMMLLTDSLGEKAEKIVTKLTTLFNIFPAAGAAISAVIPAIFLFISFSVSLKIQKGRIYNDG